MNILVIGNGFDLAHKLPTRYNDFLGFVERFLNIINTPQILQQGELKNTEKTVYKYIDHLIFNEQQRNNGLPQSCPSAENASGGQPATSIGFNSSSR